MTSKVKILLFTANPKDTDRLRLDAEIRAIGLVFGEAEFRDSFEVKTHLATHVDDLQNAILAYRPNVVHFSGHGTKSNEIVLEDANGVSAPVPAEALGNMFRLLKEQAPLQCVVLNACNSKDQADIIAEHVDVVVGMSDQIEDMAAISFISAFYRGLAYGCDMQKSFDLGLNQLNLEAIPATDIPHLVMVDNSAAKLKLQPGIQRANEELLWALLTVLSLALFSLYTLAIFFRWFEIELDFLTFSLGIVQVVVILASLLGSLLWSKKENLNEDWERLTRNFPALRQIQTLFRFSLAFAVTAMLIFYFGLPAIAGYQNQIGLEAQANGHYTEAIRKIRNASSLAPEKAAYHFNLGTTYELAGDFQSAAGEYRMAMEQDGALWEAYSNLGRIYLTVENNPDAALMLFLAAFPEMEKVSADSNEGISANALNYAKGILHSKVGAAYLVKGLPHSALQVLLRAEETLTKAAEDQKNLWYYQAETYRLQALAYEQIQDSDKARQAWMNMQSIASVGRDSDFCKENASLTNFTCLAAQMWADEATERLGEFPSQ